MLVADGPPGLLLLAGNPHSPPRRTVGTRAGPPLLCPLYAAEQVLQVVSAALAPPRHPLAPPRLHLLPVVGEQL